MMIALAAVLSTNCAHEYSHQQIQVLRAFPACFEKLGLVESEDGFSAHTLPGRTAPGGKESVALAKLREAAGELGADQVVLTYRKRSGQPTEKGSISNRPLVHWKLKGMAIKRCSS